MQNSKPQTFFEQTAYSLITTFVIPVRLFERGLRRCTLDSPVTGNTTLVALQRGQCITRCSGFKVFTICENLKKKKFRILSST